MCIVYKYKWEWSVIIIIVPSSFVLFYFYLTFVIFGVRSWDSSLIAQKRFWRSNNATHTFLSPFSPELGLFLSLSLPQLFAPNIPSKLLHCHSPLSTIIKFQTFPTWFRLCTISYGRIRARISEDLSFEGLAMAVWFVDFFRVQILNWRI